MERSKNATRNIIFDWILKLYNILTPFLLRTIMIYVMGVQYLGLNSLFASILQTLNLMELGVGSAMVYSMYKPIAENDHETLSSLLNLYKWYYRVIGMIVAVIGLALLPFLPKLVTGDIPEGISINVLYLLNLGATVLSYWLFAYKSSLLSAYQRKDIIYKVSLVISTLTYAIQILVLLYFKNYYLYVVVALITQVLNNICVAIIVTKMYPECKARGMLPKEKVKDINGKIRDLFTSKLGAVILNASDTLVISAFIGISMLGIYQNYYFIVTSIIGFVDAIFNGCMAGIGNSIATETKEKNMSDLKKLSLLIEWICCICCCCFLGLFQPFIVLWVGERFLLPFSIVISLVVYFYTYEINKMLNTYKDAAGLWHEDRFRPLITALVNLTLNLFLVTRIGLLGVINSTVLSQLLVGIPWLLNNLFSTLFDKTQKKDYILTLVKNSFFVIIICIVTSYINSFVQFNLVLTLACRLIISVSIPSICMFALFYKTEEFKWIKSQIKKILRIK